MQTFWLKEPKIWKKAIPCGPHNLLSTPCMGPICLSVGPSVFLLIGVPLPLSWRIPWSRLSLFFRLLHTNWKSINWFWESLTLVIGIRFVDGGGNESYCSCDLSSSEGVQATPSTAAHGFSQFLTRRTISTLYTCTYIYDYMCACVCVCVRVRVRLCTL